jgi:hypothetical protein
MTGRSATSPATPRATTAHRPPSRLRPRAHPGASGDHPRSLGQLGP